MTTAEVELLSSTSHDVCELWDGNQIVRATGQPKDMMELIVLGNMNEENQEESRDSHIFNLETAEKKGLIEAINGDFPPEDTHKIVRRLMEQAPNITLNVPGITLSKFELWIWAAIGLAVQTAALIVPGLAVYLWKWQKGGDDIVTYGYPCFLSGSLAIIVGVLGCSYVIEKRTEELSFHFHRRGEALVRSILRVQKAGTVGDQHFQSYAIMNEPSDCILRTSRLKVEEEGNWR